MTIAGASPVPAARAEECLRATLADCDAGLAAFAPLLRRLLNGDDTAAPTEEILARVRGMLLDVAEQLLVAHAEAAHILDITGYVEDYRGGLLKSLTRSEALLRHVHSLALEGQLCEELRLSRSLDPVLPPLLQELISSPEERISALALAVLASQARFMESYRRMKLPLRELPGAITDAVLTELRSDAIESGRGVVEQAVETLREELDESACRTALLAQLVQQQGPAGEAELSVSRAGVSHFASALAAVTRQPREVVILSTSESQLPRLAVLLGAAGCAPAAIAEQLFTLYPNAPMPEGLGQLTSESALAALADASLDGTS